MLLTFHIFYILWKNSLSTTIKKTNVLLIFTLCKAIENGNLLALMSDSTALDSLYFIIWSDSVSKTLYQPLLYNILLLPRPNKLWRVKRVSQAAPSSKQQWMVLASPYSNVCEPPHRTMAPLSKDTTPTKPFITPLCKHLNRYNSTLAGANSSDKKHINISLSRYQG